MVVTTDENSLPVSENVARSPDAKTVQLLSKMGEYTPSQDKASPRFLIASSPVLHRGVATPQRRADSACVLNEVEPQVTLETYKDVIDSTTEVVEADADLPDEGRDLENCEWKDPTTGALLGYAAFDDENACEEMSADDVTAAAVVDESLEEEEEDEEAALPLQVTVEWQQQATGTMMGYALCGDDEEDIQAMSQLFEEQDEEVETVQSQTDEEETPSTDEWTDACGENASEWVDAHSGVLLQHYGFTEGGCDANRPWWDMLGASLKQRVGSGEAKPWTWSQLVQSLVPWRGGWAEERWTSEDCATLRKADLSGSPFLKNAQKLVVQQCGPEAPPKRAAPTMDRIEVPAGIGAPSPVTKNPMTLMGTTTFL